MGRRGLCVARRPNVARQRRALLLESVVAKATFVSRPSPAPDSRTPIEGPRATLPITLERDAVLAQFKTFDEFAHVYAAGVTSGSLRLSQPLPPRLESPVGCTIVIGDDRFPAQRLKVLDVARDRIELMPSPALLSCISRRARAHHAGRPIVPPYGAPRAAPRFETSLDVQFTDVPHLAERYASDISHGGLFVACTPQPELFSKHELRMQLPDGTTLEVPVQVVHRVTDGPAPGVGVQFVCPNEEVMAPIRKLLEQYELRRPRVLVIDDEAIWRSTLARVFEPLGADVVLARDGREGLIKLTEQLFELDLVVLDLHMPYLDGRGLLERVRRNGNELGLRLFLFSAAGPDELAALGETQLATAVFSKLDPIDSLSKRLAEELGKTPPHF